ncbi:hypothetical protein OBK24_11390 [Empedobacter falsenii]
MGLLSFLFSSNPKSEIEACKARIENFKKSIEVTKKNVANKKDPHYKKHATERIKTLRYQISKEQEKIKSLRKKK